VTIKVALRHETTYTFARPVTISPHTIRLRPASSPPGAATSATSPRYAAWSSPTPARAASPWASRSPDSINDPLSAARHGHPSNFSLEVLPRQL